MRAKIVEISDLVEGAEKLAIDQLRLVEWVVVPNFWAEGRTSWTSLPEPVATSAPSVPTISALKLKGVGAQLRSGDAITPQRVAFERRREHVGISDDGRPRLVVPEPAPYGGIYLDRALAEYNNARRLALYGCPSVLPIALYRYEGLRSKLQPDRPLGAVLTGSPNTDPERAILLFARALNEPVVADRRRTDLIAKLGDGDLLKAISRLGFEYGRTLRQFHEAGLYRYNSNPSNYFVSWLDQRVCLTDLDSSRLLDECTTIRRPLEILRDVAGAVIHLARAVVNPDALQQFSDQEIRTADPLARLLEGYFRECSREQCKSCLLDFEVEFFPESRDSGGDNSEIGEARIEAITVQRGRVFVELILSFGTLYRQSTMQERHPLSEAGILT